MTPQWPVTDVLIVPDGGGWRITFAPFSWDPPMLRMRTNARREVFPVARPDLEDLERFMWACDAPYQKWVGRDGGDTSHGPMLQTYLPASTITHAAPPSRGGAASPQLPCMTSTSLPWQLRQLPPQESSGVAGQARYWNHPAYPRYLPRTCRPRWDHGLVFPWMRCTPRKRHLRSTLQGSRGPIWRISSGSCGRAMRRTGSGWGGTGASRSSRGVGRDDAGVLGEGSDHGCGVVT